VVILGDSGDPGASTPHTDGLAMPPEWAPHERCVIAWPARQSMWGAQFDGAKRAHAATATAIARFEPVLLVARPGAGDEARAACAEAGDVADAIEVVEWPIDDSWARDIGAIVVADGKGRRAAVDFGFNAWGEKFHPYADDAEFARRMSEHLGLEHLDADHFVFEGGSVTVDGAGTVITTEECLLNPNRNPDLSRDHIEAELESWLGVDRVVWLPFGLVEDDDTDGHVDNVASCVAPGVVVAQTTADIRNPNYGRLHRNVEVLEAAGYVVRTIDVLPYAEVDGQTVVVPPTNFYLANGAVIVPVVEGPAGDAALAAIEAVMPDRTVLGVPGEVLAYGGGGVHCISQQVPA
jgi:agmatine deiminase